MEVVEINKEIHQCVAKGYVGFVVGGCDFV